MFYVSMAELIIFRPGLCVTYYSCKKIHFSFLTWFTEEVEECRVIRSSKVGVDRTTRKGRARSIAIVGRHCDDGLGGRAAVPVAKVLLGRVGVNLPIRGQTLLRRDVYYSPTAADRNGGRRRLAVRG